MKFYYYYFFPNLFLTCLEDVEFLIFILSWQFSIVAGNLAQSTFSNILQLFNGFVFAKSSCGDIFHIDTESAQGGNAVTELLVLELINSSGVLLREADLFGRGASTAVARVVVVLNKADDSVAGRTLVLAALGVLLLILLLLIIVIILIIIIISTSSLIVVCKTFLLFFQLLGDDGGEGLAAVFGSSELRHSDQFVDVAGNILTDDGGKDELAEDDEVGDVGDELLGDHGGGAPLSVEGEETGSKIYGVTDDRV